MRNLSILGETAVELPDDHRLLDLCIDVAEERVFALCGDASATAKLLTYDSNHSLIDECVLPFSAGEHVMSMHFVMEREQVVVVLASGDICTAGSAVEIVGTVDAGIAACEWSPDDEIMALVTNEARVLLMTADFDVLCEHALDEGEEESTMVNVGWGTRETQYKGRGGDALEAGGQAAGPEVQSTQIQVSWRGDGQFVAVSFVRADAREIRVFARDGQLHSVCEAAAGLEHTLAWKPSGRLIAATEKRAHRHDVVFFERNGLRHGEFALRADTRRALALSWNADSSVLAAVVDAGDAGVCVQLWADRNYHWYLKQELRGSDIRRAVWDPEDPMHMLVVRAAGFTSIRMHSAPAVAHVAAAQSNTAACVVDGASVLYTPFAHANVPPPMSLHTLDAQAPVRHVAFAAFGAGNGFALLLADRRTVVLYDCDSGKACPQETRRLALPDAWQVAWPEPDVVVSLGARGVAVTRISDEPSTHFCMDARESPLVLLTAAPHVGLVLVEDARGHVFSLNTATESLEPVAELPAMCVEIDAVDCGTLGVVVVGRTSRNQLFANARLLSPACSSFFLRRDVLVFTTTTHYVRFVAADAGLITNDVPTDDEAVVAEARRRIERGSAIVAAEPVGDAVVFQMPRGNLETVRPRALVLAAVRRALDARQYRAALLACRVNRIDMNMLYDHAPAAFMADVAEFVAQINEPDLLNLFVTGLRDEDVTLTMYAGIQTQLANEQKDAKHAPGANEGKTTAVCRALRPELASKDASRFMPTVLTTLMCEKPPAIDAALGIIAALEQEERDAALTYLLFLSDVDTVYNAALGLYDLPLALLVAQRSQRDPREYLPALGALNALPSEEYRRFKIDAQLKRYERALEHMCVALREDPELWAEMTTFVKQHALYKEGLRLLADHARVGDLFVQYGDELAADKQWGQAAATYLLSGKATAAAVDAFVQNKEWRSAMALASSPGSGFGVQAVHDTAKRASAVLEAHHMFGDAAAALLEYTEETEDAVMLLVRGALWAEAVRSSLVHGRADLIETTVRPGMDTAFEGLEEDIGEIREAFVAKVARLREVRLTPLSAMLEIAAADDNVDVMSDTASMASQFSTFTATLSNMSQVTGSTARQISKTKRRAERKRVRGKKGSVFEESYLVDSLAKLIARVRVHQAAVRDLNLVLLQFGKVEAAAQLQREFADLVDLVLRDGDWVFDCQRVLVQDSAGQVDLVDDVNADGLPATPRLPKPVLPSADAWKISALV
ncbi:putative elongator complex protein 1 [Coemansia erecta]|nr:putative elongator complex protein 1 [Coemansia erecta]